MGAGRALKARRNSDSESENVKEARLWARQVRSACEELFGNPFNAQIRAQLIDLLVEKSPQADAFMRQAISENARQHGHDAEGRGRRPSRTAATYRTAACGS